MRTYRSGSEGMDTYRCCVLGHAGNVELVREFECKSLEDAKRVGRRVLESDPWFSGIELWQGGRRVHTEFREKISSG